jgi:hypothetical protein
MTRRAFGRFVAAGVGAGISLSRFSTGSARSLRADDIPLKIYAFYPKEDGVMTDCKACQNHAKHKRFATLEAARGNRAHPGCRCAILMIPASEEQYLKMFGGTIETVDRLIYDLRWPLAT